MFSHALVSYMSELLQFSKKAAATIEAISRALLKNPRYDFCLLKDLSQNEEKCFDSDSIQKIDPDQTLFFKDDYNDNESDTTENPNPMACLNDITSDSTHKEISTLQLLQSFSKSPESDLFCPKNSYKTDISMDIPHVNQQQTTYSSVSNVKHESSLINSSKSKKVHPWMDFFANLDPLVNPAEFDLKLNSSKINFQQT